MINRNDMPELNEKLSKILDKTWIGTVFIVARATFLFVVYVNFVKLKNYRLCEKYNGRFVSIFNLKIIGNVLK